MDTDRSVRGDSSERLIHGRLTELLIGHFFDVCNELGGGFVESVYAGALRYRAARRRDLLRDGSAE